MNNNQSGLREVPIKISFPEEEKKIEEYWNINDSFQESLKQSKDKKMFSFYDGPPFATGLPHYGHILAGTIKDTVTRYAHQTGHYVERRFGWDCHGLPIEFHIDEELNLKTRDSVIQYGIGNYNEKCREIVMKYSSEWEIIVKRLGRWIDFKDDYKTMDVEFMESVWWVFKQLWDKELVYRGVKVMPFSIGCHTPLSNFEANLDYRDIEDPALTVSFPLVEDESTHMVAWTTTPWTLPSNLALCVNPKFTYLKLKDKQKQITYIVAESRLEQIYPTKKAKKGEKVELDYEVVGKILGSELKGKRYKPIFDFFKDEEKNGAFQVLNGEWVTSDSGTGVVHCAPGFGADDYNVCLEAGIITKNRCPSPVDDNGCYTSEISEYVGLNVTDKETETKLKIAIKNRGRMVRSDVTKHSYPFCWRSGTKLLYKAVPSWFVNVEVLRDRLVENNKQTRWVPDFVGEKRFHNWLEAASDWCISRNRFWGTPIPIWTNEDFTEFEVIGSLKELEERTGHKADDIHRHKIDHLTIKGKTGELRRIDEVFDCWFESGSMPYSQQHYPFENKERFENGYFPADFIAEGLDQTRGWFYTLTILSTALFDRPAFKNVIVNGLVLAEDGKKMSKSKKNYPDPMLIINQYGADALRLYLINSPSVRAEPLKFKESDVKKVLKDVFLPWFNAFRFFVENTKKWEREHNSAFVYDASVAKKSSNVMDKWILSSINTLVGFVRKEMENYRLYTVLPALIKFIEHLTNWYIRFNRKRLRGNKDNGEKLTKDETLEALSTLCYVHLKLVLVMAPAAPFFSEYVYQNIKTVLPKEEQQSSVHHCMIPEPDLSFVDQKVEEDIALLQRVVELGRIIRTTKDLALKLPLEKFVIVNASQSYLDRLLPIQNYIISELNIKQLVLTSNQGEFIKLTAKLDNKKCGNKFKNDMSNASKEVANWDNQRVQQFINEGKATLFGKEITTEDAIIFRQFTGDEKKQCAQWDDNLLAIMDILIDENQKKEFTVRTIANKVQKLRKQASIHPKDPIHVFFTVKKGALFDLLNEKNQILQDTIQKPIFIVEVADLKKPVKDGSETFNFLGSSLNIDLCWD